MITPIELRNLLHQHPELALQEFYTTKLLEKSIKEIAKFNKINIKIHKPLDTGLVIEYKVNDSSFTLFRADIDALPTVEDTGFEYSSTNGNMHACGHDIHMAILYGFIQHIFESKPNQNFLFIFQPAEEAIGGAKKILDSGILDNFHIDKAFALHVTDDYPEGTIATNSSTLFASALEIDVEFFGKSSHIAFPDKGKNALSALRLFMDNVDKIPQNYVEPIIFGFGKIESGKVRNIIPDYAHLQGSIRSLKLKETYKYIKNLEKILMSIRDTIGVKGKITLGAPYKEVVNSKELFQSSKEKLSDFNFIECKVKMTGEDFGYFAAKYPSLMFWLGTNTGNDVGLHNPKFLPNESVIAKGINIFKTISKQS